MYNTEKFEKGLEDLGITLSEKQIGQFFEILRDSGGVEQLHEPDGNYGI